MRHTALLLLPAAAAVACSDGAGNSLSVGGGGTLRAYHGRVSH
ncbi:hypothetical protein [Craurococcus roseus]